VTAPNTGDLTKSDDAAMTNGGQTDSAARALGRDLGLLRRSKGVSGQELARLTGFSQSTISRIETGQKVPIPEDVETFVAALGEGGDSVRQFRVRAEALFGRPIESAEDAVGRFQPQHRDYEERARTIRVFQPTLVPGLLQTSEYARGVVSQYSALFHNPDPARVNEAVAERIQRQQILDKESKSFTFLLMESVLEYPTVPPVDMASQLSAIRRAIRRPNVTLLIIRSGQALPYPAVHGFQLFDDSRVLAETITTVVSSTAQPDLELYATLFDAYAGRATAAVEPILSRHQERWRGLGE
jgi:transcriptional regulator with XRE-family HTH domain